MSVSARLKLSAVTVTALPGGDCACDAPITPQARKTPARTALFIFLPPPYHVFGRFLQAVNEFFRLRLTDAHQRRRVIRAVGHIFRRSVEAIGQVVFLTGWRGYPV